MKKTLLESLVDYNMAMLRALADVRGAVLTSNHQSAAVEELAAQLSTPTSVAIALTDLSPAEREALATLQAAGGWMETPRFARRFGAVRTMGPARLERERPWESPANPAEGLWYRGLIFKGFRQTEAGVVEVVYVPDDLLTLLPEVSPRELTFALAPAATPPRVQPATVDLVEDVFGVLVHVRNHDVRLGPDDTLRPKDLQAINALFVSPAPAANVAHDDRLAFVLRLCRASDLVAVAQGRLVLNPNPARAWLQAPPARRLLELQMAWRDDADWNDLWHVPSLKPQPTGWKNNPILARRKVLGFLAHCRPGTWYGLDDLVTTVKSVDPDFQRPGGDYTTWYIHDQHGEPLMGFEHWDEVEGALLRYVLSGPLHWLGVTDLGFEEDPDSPAAFRLAETGLPLLGLAPSPATAPAEGPVPSAVEGPVPSAVEGPVPSAVEGPVPSAVEGPVPSTVEGPVLVVRDDLTVRIRTDASLYDRFQLSRFADLMEREADRVSYRISSASLARARRQGITVGQVSAFLRRASGDRVPASVLDGLRRWHDRSGAIWLEQGVVLRVDRPETLKALRQDRAIAPLLGDVLGPQAVLVPRANVSRVRRWLAEQGYLETGD